MKSGDADEPFRLAAKGAPSDPGHPNTLTLDITAVPPDEAAMRILAHAGELTSIEGR